MVFDSLSSILILRFGAINYAEVFLIIREESHFAYKLKPPIHNNMPHENCEQPRTTYISHRSHNNKQPNSKALHKDPVRKHLQWHKRPPTKFHNCRKRQFEKKQAQKANDTHTRRQKQRKISPAPQECKLECFLRIRRCQHSLKSILWNTQPSIQYSLPHEATVTQKGKRQEVDDFRT